MIQTIQRIQACVYSTIFRSIEVGYAYTGHLRSHVACVFVSTFSVGAVWFVEICMH